MRALPSQESCQRHRAGAASAWLPAVLLAICVQAAAQEAQEEVAAVWKVREVSFSYRSYITIYPCYELESRVSAILRAVGARDDLRVRVTDCDQFSELPDDPVTTWQSPSDRFLDRGRSTREQFAHVRVRLMMPVEVTPEVLTELQKDQKRRELVSRVTGDPAASLDHPIVFPAKRQPVTLSRRYVDLEPEDCELVEQISRSVLRRLDVRVVRSPTCDRNSPSRMSPQLTVEVLTPVLMAEAPEEPPPSGGAAEASEPAAAETKPSDPTAAETKPSEPTDPEPVIPPE